MSAQLEISQERTPIEWRSESGFSFARYTTLTQFVASHPEGLRELIRMQRWMKRKGGERFETFAEKIKTALEAHEALCAPIKAQLNREGKARVEGRSLAKEFQAVNADRGLFSVNNEQ